MFRLDEVFAAARLDAPASARTVVLDAAHYDSRRIEPGMLFVALPGERVDGNDFVAAAFDAGAAAALCARPAPSAPPDRQVVTPDALAVFQQLARARRERSEATVVGVTGSNGKTTTKDAIAAALAAAGPTLATARSENTDIGIPTTLSRLRPDHRFAVVEMGAQVRGEIRGYCEYVRPDAAVITNISGAHLGLFQSVDAIAAAKAELAPALPPDGPLILPAGDPWTPWLRQQAAGPVSTFGAAPEADVRVAGRFRADGLGTIVAVEIGARSDEFVIEGVGGPIDLACGAALALCRALGVDVEAAIDGLGGLRPPAHRMRLSRLQSGALVIDDSYNANRASMLVALEALRAAPVPGRRVAVLGDMFELGEFASVEHQAVGAGAGSIDRLICIGDVAREIRAAAIDAGLDADATQFIKVDTQDAEAVASAARQAADVLRDLLGPEDAVLLKASNGMGFASIAAALAPPEESADG